MALVAIVWTCSPCLVKIRDSQMQILVLEPEAQYHRGNKYVVNGPRIARVFARDQAQSSAEAWAHSQSVRSLVSVMFDELLRTRASERGELNTILYLMLRTLTMNLSERVSLLETGASRTSTTQSRSGSETMIDGNGWNRVSCENRISL